MTARHVLKSISITVIVAVTTSCHPAEERKLSEKHAVYLNQCLLREAIPGIAQIWNTPIELDADLASIKDLWVDYAPGQEVSLRTALDGILRFVKVEHAVTLRWSASDGRITIGRPSEQEGEK